MNFGLNTEPLAKLRGESAAESGLKITLLQSSYLAVMDCIKETIVVGRIGN